MKSSITLKTATFAIVLAFGATTFNAMAFDTDAVKVGQAPLATEFKKLDTSSNGLLSADEAAKDKLFTQTHFAKADLDNDGTLDQNEYANYKSAAQQKVVGRVVDDSVITAKAKAEILGSKDLKSLQISVETRKGEVILSGFVDNQAMKDKAEKVVAKIDGVKSVKNSLEIKS
jgi:hyperosmotically inducible periplasmic protein